MNLKFFFFFTMLAAFLHSCVFLLPSDGAIRVTGKLIFQDTAVRAEELECEIKLFEEFDRPNDKEMPVRTNDFLLTFVIAPFEIKGAFEVICLGYTAYTSETYLLSTSKFYESPLDLGEINLVPSSVLKDTQKN